MDWNTIIEPALQKRLAEEYQKGWNDCAAAMAQAVQKAVPRQQTSNGKAPPDRQQHIEMPALAKGTSTPDLVLGIIRLNPGKKGSEIVDAVAKRLNKNRRVVNHTVRTALGRLKNKRKLIDVDENGGWHPTK